MDDLDRILKTLEELEGVLKRNNYVGANPAALGRVQFLCDQMRGTNGYISEKAGQLRELASIFYSARRHLKYPGGGDRLYAEISYDLPSRIRGQVEHLKRSRLDQDGMS